MLHYMTLGIKPLIFQSKAGAITAFQILHTLTHTHNYSMLISTGETMKSCIHNFMMLDGRQLSELEDF